MNTKQMIGMAALGALLCGCHSTEGMSVRTTVTGAISELSVDTGTESGDVDGGGGSARVEFAQEPEHFSNVQVGLRVGAGGHSFSESANGLNLDVDTFDLEAVAVVRPFIDLSDNWRLYGEGFAGYRHTFGDSTLSDSFGAVLSDSGDDGGFLFGAGLGAEYALSQRSRLLLGVEWSRYLTEDAGIDLDTDDLAAMIGMAWNF